MAAPVNTVAPALTGNAVVGQTLTTTNGTWTGTAPVTYARAWYRLRPGGTIAAIAGETGLTYALAAADAGCLIAVIVTATNGDGSTTAWSNTAGLATSQAGNVATRATMRDRARFRADVVGDAHITDAEVNGWLDDGLSELHDVLIESHEEWVTKTASPDITLVSGTSQYDAPGDLLKLVGCDVIAGSRRYSCQRYMPAERNAFVYPVPAVVQATDLPFYRLVGAKIELIPTPAAAGTMRVYYVPQYALMTADNGAGGVVNPVVPIGWENVGVLHAAICAIVKQERDPSALMAEKSALVERIKASAHGRDEGQPWRVVDVRGSRVRRWR